MDLGLAALLPFASAAFVPLPLQHRALTEEGEAKYVAPDCICAGVVPNCDDTGLIQKAVDTLLSNNCNAGITNCATNPICRDAFFYAHAHNELCKGGLNEHYAAAFENFAKCPVCTTEGAGANCAAAENKSWDACGNITVGSGRLHSACPVNVKMGFDVSDKPCPVVAHVNITNLSYKQDFSPVLVVFHTPEIYEGVSLFTEGKAASDAMTKLAEEGDISGLLDIAADPAVAPYICGAAAVEETTGPGEQLHAMANLTYGDTCYCGYLVATVVGKLMNTNDGFFAIESMMFPQEASADGDHWHDASPTTVYPLAYDAGTEANTEKCTDIPGPACDSSANARVEDGAEGIVHVHRGLHGDADLGHDYSWGHSVAKIVITLSSEAH